MRVSGRTETKTYGKAADTSAFQTITGLKVLWQGMRLPGESLGHHFPEKNSSREKRTTHKSLKRWPYGRERAASGNKL
jgi:hypothetical protein